MKVKKWKIEKLAPSDYSISTDDIVICINGLWVDDKYWHLYLDGNFIARLQRRTNQIVNYDEYGEELDAIQREYEEAEYDNPMER